MWFALAREGQRLTSDNGIYRKLRHKRNLERVPRALVAFGDKWSLLELILFGLENPRNLAGSVATGLDTIANSPTVE
jgi:hypothetical protein